MPFGLKSAPRIWTRFLRLVVAMPRRQGIRVVIYLDDFLIMNPTREGCHRDTVTVVNTLRSLGLLLAASKCETIPTQRILFLGLELFTVDMMFYVPAKKRNNFLADSQRLLQLARQGHVRLRQLAGWIDSADPAVAQDARTANERDADAAEN